MIELFRSTNPTRGGTPVLYEIDPFFLFSVCMYNPRRDESSSVLLIVSPVRENVREWRSKCIGVAISFFTNLLVLFV